MPTESLNILGHYPAILNSPPRLLADPGPGEHSSPKVVTSQTRDCQKNPRYSLVNPSPQTQTSLKPSSAQLMLRIAFLFLQHSICTAQPQRRWGNVAQGKVLYTLLCSSACLNPSFSFAICPVLHCNKPGDTAAANPARPHYQVETHKSAATGGM